jgi:hypothetical protein
MRATQRMLSDTHNLGPSYIRRDTAQTVRNPRSPVKDN